MPDGIWVPEHRVSLYGTELWDAPHPRAAHRARCKHEACSVASVGLWFEVLLMQRLLKDFYAEDPTNTPRAVRAHRGGRRVPPLPDVRAHGRHGRRRALRAAGVDPPARQALPSVVSWGPASYGAILVAEEVLDRLQREQAGDERVQPLMRQVNRIHIMEEARHVSFARDEVTRGMALLSPREKAYQRFIVAFISMFVVRSLINPKVYAAVGIDPKEGRRAALANPHHREMIRWAGEKIMPFLTEAGLVGRPGMTWWRRSFLLSEG